MTAAAVPALVDEVEAEAERLVERVATQIRREVPAFVRVPASTLERAIHGNLTRALAALRELREPTAEELELAAAVGRERAEQGLAIDAVLHAYRISITAVWSRFGDHA